MGTGKSLMALETAKRTGLKTLVICPPFLVSTWENEASQCGVKVAIISYTQLNKFKAKDLSKYQFWIADEAHYLKNPKAQRTHAFYALIKECLPEYFIGLTGTPIKNRVPDFWTLLAICRLNPKDTSGLKLEGELTQYYAFSRYFCNVRIVRVAGRRIENFVGIKEEKIPEFKALLANKMIRYKVEDVLKDLPDMTRQNLVLGIKDVEGLEEEFKAYIEGHKVTPTAKKNSALLKAKNTAEYCAALYEGGSGPLVIFTDHVDAAAHIAKDLKGAKCITGKTSMPDRAEFVAEFQNGRTPYLIATIGALSVGVTLTAARHVVFNDLSWTPADNLQAEKRIHRIGQKNACFAHYIDATPTDVYIRETLFKKLEAIGKVIE